MNTQIEELKDKIFSFDVARGDEGTLMDDITVTTPDDN